MLSNVLNSHWAIYSKLRGLILTQKDILLKLRVLESKMSRHDDDFKLVFAYLNELLNPESGPLR